MTTENTNTTEVESAVSDYEASANAVTEAEKALETAKAQREEKKALAEKKLTELKDRLSALDSSEEEEEEVVVEPEENIIEATSSKLEEKLNDAKDEWAKLAQTNPDEARRQLRKFWIIVAGSIGIVTGGSIMYLITLLF